MGGLDKIAELLRGARADVNECIDALDAKHVVSCSQCGREFGPGRHGFSHCENHAGLVSTESGLERVANLLREASADLALDNLRNDLTQARRRATAAASSAFRDAGGDLYPNATPWSEIDVVGQLGGQLRDRERRHTMFEFPQVQDEDADGEPVISIVSLMLGLVIVATLVAAIGFGASYFLKGVGLAAFLPAWQRDHGAHDRRRWVGENDGPHIVEVWTLRICIVGILGALAWPFVFGGAA